ncbi:MAG TPA: hypothetical protein VFI24_07240 [Pyrinomonadaceae bacterium]|nr:hypothetical protein [Pyrinomonadaceae bacterium]
MFKIRVHLWLILFTLYTPLAFSQAPNCGCEQKPQLNVLAVVNGVKIREEDLSIDTRTQVSLAQETVTTARAQELDRHINQMLLAAEAKRRGITTETLFVLEVRARVPPPTETEARAFYEQNKKRLGKSFGSVKNDIFTQLRNERETIRAYQYANALRAGAQITESNLRVSPPANEADLARVFANVNGVNITSADIEQSLLPMIFLVQKQVYELRKRDLDLRINDLLLDQEAKRLGTTPKALIDLNVRTKVPIASEDQARAYYKQHEKDFPGKFSDYKLRLMQFLQAQEDQKQSAIYAEELRRGAAVQIYLTAPTAPDLRQLCCNPVD